MNYGEKAKEICQDKRHGIPALEMRRRPFDCENCNRIAKALQEAHDAGLEDAAKATEEYGEKVGDGMFIPKEHEFHSKLRIARAIRALKSKGGK